MPMDLEQRQHLEGLRQIYLKRLRALEQQAATFGSQTPPHILIEIDEARAKIADLDGLINEVQQPLPHTKTATASLPHREYARELFAEATRCHLKDDTGYALQLYCQVQQLDPTYPR